MYTKVILTPKDIRKMVAKKFEVEEKDVWVHCFTDTVGYGMGEHQEPTFEVMITKDIEQEL